MAGYNGTVFCYGQVWTEEVLLDQSSWVVAGGGSHRGPCSRAHPASGQGTAGGGGKEEGQGVQAVREGGVGLRGRAVPLVRCIGNAAISRCASG